MQDEPMNKIGEMVDMLICLTIIIILPCLSKHHVAYLKFIVSKKKMNQEKLHHDAHDIS